MFLTRNLLKFSTNIIFRREYAKPKRFIYSISREMSNTTIDINWKITCEEIKAKRETVIRDTSARCDEIASTKEFTVKNVLARFNEMERLFGREFCIMDLLSRTSPEKSIRDACTDAIAEFNRFEIEIKMRKDLFKVLEKFSENSTEKLDYESKRYLERTLIEGKRNGLNLDDQVFNRVKDLKKRISDLELQFSKNLVEENKKFAFTKEQLDGVPVDVLSGLEKNENGEYLATLKYPVYFPIMKNCTIPQTRSKMYIEFNTRSINTNTELFEEILQLRHELANLLGYKNHSEYTMELCMAKNPKNAEDFLLNLVFKLRPLYEKEHETLLKLKKDECERFNWPFDGRINQSDVKYYINLLEKTNFQIDHRKLQEYFPLDIVLDGIFNIYQTLLGLEFEHVGDAPTFHEDAKLYAVRDKESKELMGHFYTDLYPREGKYGHAAVFSIIDGCQKLDGQWQHPICAMVCNFTRPTSEKPALLNHDEVETFFHEFGHVMHQICAKANYIKFSGYKVESDFVEAPSQMLENWCWEKESLKLMSKHYSDGSPIDETLLNNLIRSKLASSAHVYSKYATAGLIDLRLHQSSKSDTRQVYQQCIKEYLLKDIEDEKLNMVPSFEHLVGGYDSKYYGYFWSEVFSQDMFDSRFKKEGILNSKTGLDYRRCILQPGGSKHADEMLLNFLGREPSSEPFLRSKGLTQLNKQ